MASMEELLEKQPQKGRYTPVFSTHYKCTNCTRELLTSALKKATHCPFCLGKLEKIEKEG